MDYALNRAIDMWYDNNEGFRQLQVRPVFKPRCLVFQIFHSCLKLSVQATCCSQDWSWNRPALDYLELYHSARK
jgi:starch synthase